MSKITKVAIVSLLCGVAGVAAAQRPASPGAAQRPSYKREVPAALARQARVSEDSALKIASGRFSGVGNRQVQAVELENENGKLIWSWEFKFPGMPGVYECNVSALDGSIVGVEHEMPATDSTHARHAAPAKPKP